MEHDSFLSYVIIFLVFAIIIVFGELTREPEMNEQETFLKATNRAQIHIEKELRPYGLQLVEIKDLNGGGFFRMPHFSFHFYRIKLGDEGRRPEITSAKVVFKNRYGKIGEVYVDIREDMLNGSTDVRFSKKLEKFEYADRDIFC